MSTTALAERLSRLASVTADETTMDVLTTRIAEGERLADIARAWDVPGGKLLAWILVDEQRSCQYLRALEIASHALVAETVGIADASQPETVGVSKLRIETRFRIAAAHAKSLYGESKQSGGSQRVTVIVQRDVPQPEAVTLDASQEAHDESE